MLDTKPSKYLIMNRSEIIAECLTIFKGIFSEEEIAKMYKELLIKFNLA